MRAHEHRRPDFTPRTVNPESHDRRLVLARDRGHTFFGDGMPELFGQLCARAPRRRRFLAQTECEGQTRLGRDPCRAPQLLLQAGAGKESHDLHESMARPQSECPALPLREPDIGPRQIVVDDTLDSGQIEPFGRNIGGEQDVRSGKRRWPR